MRLPVAKKLRPKKPARAHEHDELEQLFSQFEEQLQACEEKMGMLKQALSEFDAQKCEADESDASLAVSSPTHSP
jgi:Skp family chaperone for outer membrane proteins